MNDLIRKIPYAFFEQKNRPYLEVLFLFKNLLQESTKTLALMDTGADLNLIPFSLGNAIGLQQPEPESTEFQNAGGIGGEISYIQRDCKIYIVDSKSKRMYGFNEVVHWAYPNLETQKKLDELYKEYNNFIKLKGQSIKDTELYRGLELEEQKKSLEIKKIMDKFETTSLLGRPFFNNFEFVQFCQKDRTAEVKCFFVYRIKMSNVVDVKDLSGRTIELKEAKPVLELKSGI